MHFKYVACLFLCSAATKASYAGPDYEALPRDTIFPGLWEDNIRAPFNKSYIAPTKIFNIEGAVAGAETVLLDAEKSSGASWVISPGGLVTFEFAENIGGRRVERQFCERGYANLFEGSASMLMA
jgi:hypothetical protein